MCIVTCNKCGNTFNTGIESFKDLDFELVDSSERNMGCECTYEASIPIECGKCGQYGEIKILCWEYPIGAYNYSEVEVSEGDFTVIECDHNNLCGDYISSRMV
jgi:hypothetical protein